MAQYRDRLILGLLAAIPVTVLAVFFAYPVAGMITKGLGQGGVLEVLTRPRTGRVLGFTLWSSGLATVVAVVLGVPTAYVLHRLTFPGRTLLRGLVVVPFVLPTVVVGVAFEQLFSPTGWLGALHLDGTAVAIIAALVFFNVSVVARTVGAFWENLDPRREEAAAALGASPVQVLRTVTLPAIAPGIAASATVVFLFCSTAFGVVLTMGGLRYANVETEIWMLTTQDLDLRGAAVLSVLQIAVITALLLVAAVLRRTTPTQRAARRHRRPRRRDLPAVGGLVLVLLLVGLPIASLVARSLQDGSGWSLANYAALDTVGSGNALAVPVTQALANSLQIALIATAFSVVLGGIVAFLVTRGGRFSGLVDGVFMLPLGVSAVTLGFGFLITLNHPPIDFRFSPWLIPIAQSLVALPLVVRTVAPVLRGIDPRQRQAAASLGASPWRVARDVELPVAWRALMAATGFAFAVSLGEFGATSFLVRDDFPTLPVVIYRLISHPGPMNAGMAMAASVVLAAVTAGVMLLVERLRVGSVGAF